MKSCKKSVSLSLDAKFLHMLQSDAGEQDQSLSQTINHIKKTHGKKNQKNEPIEWAMGMEKGVLFDALFL